MRGIGSPTRKAQIQKIFQSAYAKLNSTNAHLTPKQKAAMAAAIARYQPAPPPWRSTAKPGPSNDDDFKEKCSYCGTRFEGDDSPVQAIELRGMGEIHICPICFLAVFNHAHAAMKRGEEECQSTNTTVKNAKGHGKSSVSRKKTTKNQSLVLDAELPQDDVCQLSNTGVTRIP